MIQPTQPAGKNSNLVQNPVGEQPARNASPTDLVNQVLREALGPYLGILSIPIPEFQYFGGTPVEEGKGSNGNNKSEESTDRQAKAIKVAARILKEDNSDQSQNLLKIIKRDGLTQDEATKILRAGDKLTAGRVAQIVDVDLAELDSEKS